MMGIFAQKCAERMNDVKEEQNWQKYYMKAKTNDDPSSMPMLITIL